MQEVHDTLPVLGYKPQSTGTIDIVNGNKVIEETILRTLDNLQDWGADARWLAVGRTHIEQGFMAINRAIFKPERVNLDE